MSIKIIELSQGAVLARLFRNERPVSLRMIEVDHQQTGCAFLVNDEVYIYIKSSTRPTELKRKSGFSWTFSFNPDHLAKLQELRSKKGVYLALVCLQKAIDAKVTAICFINWEEISRCLDWQRMSDTQTITVKYQERCNLRVWGPKNTAQDPLNVNQGALDSWDVPGV